MLIIFTYFVFANAPIDSSSSLVGNKLILNKHGYSQSKTTNSCPDTVPASTLVCFHFGPLHWERLTLINYLLHCVQESTGQIIQHVCPLLLCCVVHINGIRLPWYEDPPTWYSVVMETVWNCIEASEARCNGNYREREMERERGGEKEAWNSRRTVELMISTS